MLNTFLNARFFTPNYVMSYNNQVHRNLPSTSKHETKMFTKRWQLISRQQEIVHCLSHKAHQSAAKQNIFSSPTLSVFFFSFWLVESSGWRRERNLVVAIYMNVCRVSLSQPVMIMCVPDREKLNLLHIFAKLLALLNWDSPRDGRKLIKSNVPLLPPLVAFSNVVTVVAFPKSRLHDWRVTEWERSTSSLALFAIQNPTLASLAEACRVTHGPNVMSWLAHCFDDWAELLSQRQVILWVISGLQRRWHRSSVQSFLGRLLGHWNSFSFGFFLRVADDSWRTWIADVSELIRSWIVLIWLRVLRVHSLLVEEHKIFHELVLCQKISRGLVFPAPQSLKLLHLLQLLALVPLPEASDWRDEISRFDCHVELLPSRFRILKQYRGRVCNCRSNRAGSQVSHCRVTGIWVIAADRIIADVTAKVQHWTEFIELLNLSLIAEIFAEKHLFALVYFVFFVGSVLHDDVTEVE